jgi:hypothetical protein
MLAQSDAERRATNSGVGKRWWQGRDRQVDGAGVTSERVSVTDSRGLEAFSGKPRQQGPPAGGDGQSSR